eukprot:9964243-Lingulodinium_polyedra.AAC.1
MRGKFQVSKDFAPWTTRKGVCLRGVPPHCHRVRDMLDMCFIEQLQQNAKKAPGNLIQDDELAKGLWCDVSQG